MAKGHAIDFYLELAKGGIPKHSAVNKFGFNLDVDTGSLPETIWSYGGEISFVSTGAALSVVSTSTNDDTGGTGARKIKVQGLNSDYELIEEEITMDGTTAVASTTYTNWLRVHRAFVTSAGSLEHNAGAINISISSTVQAQIPAEYSQTQQAIYTIPANHTGYITNFSGSIIRAGNNKSASLSLYKRIDGVARSIQEIGIQADGTTNASKEFVIPIKIEEKSDLYVNATSANADNTNIFSNFGLVLVNNN